MGAARRIAVIGAGVLGLAIARELAGRGAQVHVFEKEHIGAGTSGTTYAWVNANGKQPDSYHRLNVAGMQAHERVQQQLQPTTPWFVRSGTLEWADTEAAEARLQQRVGRLQAHDYDARPLDPSTLRSMVPELRDPLPEAAWWFPAEGIVQPHLLLAHLWVDARRRGVELVAPGAVVEVVEHTDQVTLRTAQGATWTGDRLVIAAGRWSAAVTALVGTQLAMVDAGVPGRIGCGLLGYTEPVPAALSHNLITPGLNVRPDGGGRLLLQAPALDDRADPGQAYEATGEVGRALLDRLASLLRLPAPVRLARIAVGQRSRPADGLPAIGHLTDRTYLAAAHSGITLALAVGELVGEELITGRRPELLAEFAPDRLLDRDPAEFGPISTIHFPAAQ